MVASILLALQQLVLSVHIEARVMGLAAAYVSSASFCIDQENGHLAPYDSHSWRPCVCTLRPAAVHTLSTETSCTAF
jgi:hypothetical protein